MTCFRLFLSFSKIPDGRCGQGRAKWTGCVFGFYFQMGLKFRKNYPLNIHHIVVDLILGHNVWCGINEQDLDHLP